MNPKVELRNVKHAAFASQETECFAATVYIDGKKEGSVENAGHGGSNNYHPYQLKDKLDAIAETMPDIPIEGHEPLKQDADCLIGDVLNAYLNERRMKRLRKTKTLFRVKSETYEDGEWRTFQAPYSLKVQDYLDKKYGVGNYEVYGEPLRHLAMPIAGLTLVEAPVTP